MKGGAWLVVAAVLPVWPLERLAAEEVRGYASVKSSNEILIGKRIIRLFGIRAPKIDDICQIESAKMKCGVVAWSQLIQLADGWHLSCDIELKARSGNFCATCYSGERDINEGMGRKLPASAPRLFVNRPIGTSWKRKTPTVLARPPGEVDPRQLKHIPEIGDRVRQAVAECHGRLLFQQIAGAGNIGTPLERVVGG